MTYVEISVAGQHTKHQYFTYSSNKPLNNGQIVAVMYGKKQAYGIVCGAVKKPTFTVKPVVEVTAFTLPTTSILLLHWLEQYYPYQYGELAQLFTPPNISVNARKTIKPDTAEQPQLAKLTFTKDQQTAFNKIQESPHVLLHGDTGTGKTLVFLREAQKILNNNQSVLILTPEIGLTPQLEVSIKQNCNAPLFTTHSQMTPAVRKKVWMQAYASNTPAVYLGPRSSLFLPFKNLGLIVIDESHDSSFDNMQSPKYHGLYVAAKLANIHKARFIQSSATPNVTDYVHAVAKKVPILRMQQMPLKNTPANGQIIDMTNKDNLSSNQLFSEPLLKALTQTIQSNKQSLLFLNKRGTARIVQCASCGAVKECPSCNLALTYHHNTNKLLCHQCNYSELAQPSCYNCGSTNLLYTSPGTKAVERDLAKMFPSAKIARFDIDSTKQEMLAQRINEIKQGNIDIIVGTQLITKGLDLPYLGLVGILNADTTLQLPDYHAEERAFQQLYQVSGRVGRGHSADNKFIIQTRLPEHPVIKSALARDWPNFYKYETSKRKQYNYPPFCYLSLLKITKKTSASAQKASQKALQVLQQKHIITLGPSPSFYATKNGYVTWQIIAKSPHRQQLLTALRQLSTDWSVDMDATSTL